MKRQRGFTTIHALLALIMIALIGTASFFAFKNFGNNSSQYLVINEWNTRIKLRDAAKVTYEYSQNIPGQAGPAAGIPDSSIMLKVKPEYLADKNCQVGVGWSRYSKLSAVSETPTKIGVYYFMANGNPESCANTADNELTSRIREDYAQMKGL